MSASPNEHVLEPAQTLPLPCEGFFIVYMLCAAFSSPTRVNTVYCILEARGYQHLTMSWPTFSVIISRAE
jgi:hypothetical protein